jgi:hypothetical protein
LQAAKAKAQQFGSQEAAAWLEQASQKIRQEMELAKRAGQGPDRETRQGREDGERRLQHLRAAIDNLRAAGMGQMADALEREVSRGLQARPDQRVSPGGPRERAGRDDRPDMERRRAGMGPNGPSGNLQQDVQQLRGEVQSLHQQLNEMREMLKRLTPHEQNREHRADSPGER